MIRRTSLARSSVAVLGAGLLLGVASVAMAADQVGDPSDVDIQVDIAPVATPGVLAMTVDGTSTALTENGSTPTVRQFTGKLPTVTVTDTRTAEETPDDAYWYVVGSTSDFVGTAGQAPVSPNHLGWTPSVEDPGGTGAVAAGPEVATVLDESEAPNNVGVVDEELLALAPNSEQAAGSWKAAADLFLKVPVNTAPGSYSATITLSLFE